MLFLNPIMLAGIGGAVVPLILHLLSRARYRNVEWGAMMFLADAGVRQQQTARLRMWLLLLLRMAIVALLAMALARPVLSATGWGAGPVTGQASVVIVLDCSLSMTYKPQGASRTRFDVARDAALRLLSNLRPGDRVSLIRAGDPSGPPVSDPTPDTQRLAAAIAELKPADGKADIAASLDAAMTVVEQQEGDRQIYVITDGQAVSWSGVTEEFQTAWKARAELTPVRIGVIPIGEGGDNILIERIELANAPAIASVPADFDVTVRNESPVPRNGVPVTLRTAQPPGATGKPVMIDLEPNASKTVRVPTTFPAGEQVISALVESGVGISADDHLEHVVEVHPPIQVLVISGDERSGAFRSESDFFRTALNPFESAGLAKASIASVKVLPADRWTEEDLVDCQVLVLANVAELSAQQARTIEQFVSAGGGLLVAPGSLTRTEQFNQSLYRQGTGALPVPLLPAVPVDAQSTTLSKVDTTHPIFRFMSAVTTPTVRSSFWRLFPIGSEVARSPAPRTLGSYSNGRPFLVEIPFAQGRVLLLTTPIDNDWSDLPLTKFYLPFVQSMVRYLASGASLERNLDLGQTLRLESAARPVGGSWTIKRPGGATDTIQAVAAGAVWEARYGKTTQVGVYIGQAMVGDHTIARRFAVRAPVAESDLTRLAAERWESLEETLDLTRLDPTATPLTDGSFGRRIGRELWAVLLGGVLVLSILELILARLWSVAG